jgi:adenine specific DNA methylase Mod
MPYIDWLGKEDVLHHHKEIPYKTLDCQEVVGEEGSENLIIKGDNLLALKSLLPYYANAVKMIYIDPPYNTGNRTWVYSDNSDSPLIKKWLHDTVNAEDLSRSDKWLCMMYPRLKLLQQLLKEDGVIFISIDDAEFSHLKMICDEIFGRKNFIETFIWNTDGNIDNQKKIKNNHEYVLCYAKNSDIFKSPPIIDPNIPPTSKLFKSSIKNTIIKNGVKNPISKITIPNGFPANFEEGVIEKGMDGYPIKFDDIEVKDYKLVQDIVIESGWSSKQMLLDFINNDFQPVIDNKGQSCIFYITKPTGAIYVEKKRSETQSHVLSVLQNFGSTQQMSKTLSTMNISFDYPKPLALIEYLISLNDDKNAIILDSFAGTGTTAHAVLEKNKKDSGNRKFILVELEDYANDITKKRVQKVVSGYEYLTKNKLHNVEGLGGGFKYCELGAEIFDEFGELNSALSFEHIAKHLYFVEFKRPLGTDIVSEPYVGSHTKRHLYFFETRFRMLDLTKLLKEHEEHKELIIYTRKSSISDDELKKNKVVIRYIPYDIKEN